MANRNNILITTNYSIKATKFIEANGETLGTADIIDYMNESEDSTKPLHFFYDFSDVGLTASSTKYMVGIRGVFVEDWEGTGRTSLKVIPHTTYPFVAQVNEIIENISDFYFVRGNDPFSPTKNYGKEITVLKDHYLTDDDYEGSGDAYWFVYDDLQGLFSNLNSTFIDIIQGNYINLGMGGKRVSGSKVAFHIVFDEIYEAPEVSLITDNIEIVIQDTGQNYDLLQVSAKLENIDSGVSVITVSHTFGLRYAGLNTINSGITTVSAGSTLTNIYSDPRETQFQEFWGDFAFYMFKITTSDNSAFPDDVKVTAFKDLTNSNLVKNTITAATTPVRFDFRVEMLPTPFFSEDRKILYIPCIFKPSSTKKQVMPYYSLSSASFQNGVATGSIQLYIQASSYKD